MCVFKIIFGGGVGGGGFGQHENMAGYATANPWVNTTQFSSIEVLFLKSIITQITEPGEVQRCGFSNMALSSLSTDSTKPGKLLSVRHSLMNAPSCSVGKLVSAYALPRV